VEEIVSILNPWWSVRLKMGSTVTIGRNRNRCDKAPLNAWKIDIGLVLDPVSRKLYLSGFLFGNVRVVGLYFDGHRPEQVI
jgi:uncharacterized protein (UPF0212 family)